MPQLHAVTRVFFILAVIAGLASPLRADAPKIEVDNEILKAPAAGVDLSAWRAAMEAWRETTRKAIAYDGSEYARADLAWTQRDFIQPQMMVEDRYFFDVRTGRYTVDRYLDDLQARYGGIDSVLIWPVYPNIGVDNRNQLDMIRDMPGGIAGVRAMVADFHRRGVRVLFPLMAWETSGRPYEKPLPTEVAETMGAIGADGFNADAILGIPREYRVAADQLKIPLIFQSESGIGKNYKMLEWHNQTWGYWTYTKSPVVSLYKWLEPRHMINVCERWARDRTDGLQSAFFNGVGYETWENVWGIWNGITPRAAETIRRISTLYHLVAPLLISERWQPHVASLARNRDVYASEFPGVGQTLWLLVNRSDKDVDGPQLVVSAEPGARYFDLWAGRELTPNANTLAFSIEARGYGAVLAVHAGQPVPAELTTLLARMAALARQRLADYSNEWKPLPQRMVEIAQTSPATSAPAGMIRIPAARYEYKVAGVEIEGGYEPGVGVQYPWESVPSRTHQHTLDVASFYIDEFPVTNAQFKRFLDASGYRPADAHNFLKHWVGGAIPAGWERKPVIWVSLEDARAYAAWAGKRLPHGWEWQYAAQGLDGRAFPWGNAPIPAAIPAEEGDHDMRPPADVDAHPLGASPFGVKDLVGNVWQWTDEFEDEHTRAATVRGSGSYRPNGVMWYFPRAPRLDQQGKYLLMAPSKDRSAGIGFRCVKDAR